MFKPQNKNGELYVTPIFKISVSLSLSLSLFFFFFFHILFVTSFPVFNRFSGVIVWRVPDERALTSFYFLNNLISHTHMIPISVCLYNFCCTKNLIKHFKGRYNPQILCALNRVVQLRYRINVYRNKILFLQSFQDNNVAPSYIFRRIIKIKCRSTNNVLRAFLKDEISLLSDSLESFKSRLYLQWKKFWSSLSFFDLLRFSKYLSNNSFRLKSKLLSNNQQFLKHLIKKKSGSIVTTDKHIFNYSSYVLTDCEKLVPSKGLSFVCPPPRSRRINSASVSAEFELLYL